jgi:hypothetical protein
VQLAEHAPRRGMAWLLLQQVLEMDNRRPILAAAMRCSGIGKSITQASRLASVIAAATVIGRDMANSQAGDVTSVGSCQIGFLIALKKALERAIICCDAGWTVARTTAR